MVITLETVDSGGAYKLIFVADEQIIFLPHKDIHFFRYYRSYLDSFAEERAYLLLSNDHKIYAHLEKSIEDMEIILWVAPYYYVAKISNVTQILSMGLLQ